MPVTKKKETYSEAMARLEKIVGQIDNNELDNRICRSISYNAVVLRSTK